MTDRRLIEKNVLITGANRGIGAAIAEACARSGSNVFVHHFQPTAEADGQGNEAATTNADDRSLPELLAFLRRQGASVESWECDLGDPVTISALFDQAENALGSVEILVHNAAHFEADTLDPTSDQKHEIECVGGFAALPATVRTIDRHFAVNSRAFALLTSEYARRYKQRNGTSGSVIAISTDGALGHAGAVSYGASKLAIESFARAAAYELGPLGIRVNVVSPGPVQTGWIDTKLEQQIVPSIPLRRVGQPCDIADAVEFLVSDQARWITGQVLRVNGGQYMG